MSEAAPTTQERQILLSAQLIEQLLDLLDRWDEGGMEYGDLRSAILRYFSNPTRQRIFQNIAVKIRDTPEVEATIDGRKIVGRMSFDSQRLRDLFVAEVGIDLQTRFSNQPEIVSMLSLMVGRQRPRARKEQPTSIEQLLSGE